METDHLRSFLIVLGRSSLEAGTVVLLVLATQWLFRKQLTSRWRCTLWLLVVLRLLLPFSLSTAASVFNLLPVSLHSVPSRSGPSRPAPYNPPITRSEVTATTFESVRATPSSTAVTIPVPMLPASEPRHLWHWPAWIYGGWLAGVVLLAAHVAVSSIRLSRKCARLKRVTHPMALEVLATSCRLMRIQAEPALLETTELSGPALYGLFRPRLLLPKQFAERFSPLELRFVFFHELAHLKRRDLWMNWLLALLQIVHWFNPLVWFAFSRWRIDRELACDAMALEMAGEDRKEEYGRTILRLLEVFARPVSAPGLVGISEDKRQLKRRIGMILSYGPARNRSLPALLLAGALATVGLTDAQSPARSNSTSADTSNATQQKGDDMNKFDISNRVVRAAATGLLALTIPTNSSDLHAQEPAAAPSELARELIGAWVLVGTPGKVSDAPAAGGRYKFFTGKDCCITQADPKTGVVAFHHGGPYVVNGSDYFETVQYANPSTMQFIGSTNGHFTFKIEGDLLTLIGIGNPWKEVWKRADDTKTTGPAHSELASKLMGTWVLVGAPGKVGEIPAAGGRYKFVTGSHWLDTQADPKTGVIIYHHGGTYTLKGDEYLQSVQYANPTTMNLIGQSFKFIIKLEGDTLTLTGIGNPWTEVWKRSKS